MARAERCVWLVLLAGLALGAQAAEGGRPVFRYRDEHGVLHIGNSLPPGQAQLGYEVLDSHTLRLLRVVEPAPKSEQVAQQAERLRQQRAAEEAERAAQAERQNRDRMLLQTYADESELLRLRDLKLGNLELILRNTQNTIGLLRQNLAQMQATAAEHRQAGRQPPDTLLRAIERTEADLAAQERAAEQTRAEQDKVRAIFAADLERYRRLTGAATTAAP
jgi:hypothetical protein